MINYRDGGGMRWRKVLFWFVVVCSILIYARAFFRVNDATDEFPVWLMLLGSLIPAAIPWVLYCAVIFVAKLKRP
jgi:magnesium-transporting ATPase (P-type)